jgi:hypothetical protein
MLFYLGVWPWVASERMSSRWDDCARYEWQCGEDVGRRKSEWNAKENKYRRQGRVPHGENEILVRPARGDPRDGNENAKTRRSANAAAASPTRVSSLDDPRSLASCRDAAKLLHDGS